jgi:hypothetical protein
MSDLPQELRLNAGVVREHLYKQLALLLEQAADRIEKLEAAINAARKYAHVYEHYEVIATIDEVLEQ